MNRKHTKRALLSSVLALVLCFSMMLGTTFAWFTDSVTSTNNIIKAGNLDVELEYAKVVDGQIKDWDSVTEGVKVFDENALWEPGRVEVVYLKVSNLGTLALKYQLGVNVADEKSGISVKTNEEFKLSEYLVFKVASLDTEPTVAYTREEAIQAAGTVMGLEDYNGETTKLDAKGGANAEDYVALIVYMPETVENEANYKTGTEAPFINLGVKLYATQVEAEMDSFGDDYDKDAWVEGMKVYSADDLVAAIEAGESVVLMNDIAASEVIELANNTKIDLNGKTLTANLAVAAGAEVVISGGEIASASPDNSAIETVGDLTLDNVTVNSDRHGVRVEGGKTVINGGTYTAAGYAGRTQHALNVSDGGEVIVNGGTFVGPAGTASDSGSAVNVQAGSTVTINGGNFSGGKLSTLSAAGTLTVKGGTFDQDPSAYVAEGYEAKDNGGSYTVSMKSETLNNLFKDVQDGGTVTLPEGTFTIPSTVAGKEITVEGLGENTVLDFTKINTVNDASITFKNLHIQSQNANVMNGFGIQHTTGDIVYENCTFDGAVTNEYYGTVTYKNCTFTGTGYITTYAVKSATFENCVFDKADSRAVLVYSHGNNPCVVTLTDCEFKAAAKATTWSGDWTAAVEIDTTNISSAGTSVTINNCTADEMYSGIVRDKSADGKANAVITVDGQTWAFQSAQLAPALTANNEKIDIVLGKDVDCPITSLGTITGGSGEYKLGGEDTDAITIDLNGKKLNITTTYWSSLGAKNADAVFTIKNGFMTSSQETGTWNSYDVTFANCNYVIEDVVFEKSVALTNAGKSVSMKNVAINETHDYYALWITAEGQTVTIDGLTVNCGGRGIKIDEQYVDAPAKVTLNVSNAKFTTVKKAAILVKSAAGADVVVNNVDISGVAADTVNTVWVDADAAAYADLVTVTGATKITEV